MIFDLPTSVTVYGNDYRIRSDYRAVLDVCTALTDPELNDQEKAAVLLDIFYPEFADKAWEGIKQIFKGVWNGIVGIIESAVNLIIRGVNWLISQMNKISFDVPDWVPGIGGKSLGVNIQKINEISIPRLATGAVVPPNREFMAILGDNKTETEIVSPLSTMKQAVLEALRESGGLGGGTYKFELYVNGRRMAVEMVKEINTMSQQAGKSVLKI